MVTFNPPDEFWRVYFQNPFLLYKGRFVENYVILGNEVVNCFGEIFQSSSLGEVACATEAGMLKNTGFFHEALLSQKAW